MPKTKHTISAGGIVLNKKNEIALIHQGGKYWAWPKGHVEEGETKVQAAKREIYEETGIDSENLEYIKDLGSYKRYSVDDKSELKTIYLYLFRTDQHDLKPIDLKEKDAKWFKKDNVEDQLNIKEDKEYYKNIKSLF